MPVTHSERNPSAKNDLFRFVHIKEPQVIFNEELGPQPFFSHLDGRSGSFLADIHSLNDPTLIKTALDVAVASFTPMQSVADLESVSKTMYTFSNWLFKHRRNLNYDDLFANGTPAPAPANQMLITYWDNLFYQMLTDDRAVVKNSCLRLLQACNVRMAMKEFTNAGNGKNEFTSTIKKQFERAAKATILIPKNIVNYNAPIEASVSSVAKGSKAFLMSVKRTELILKQKDFQIAISELESAEVLYRRDFTAAYDAAVKANQTAIDAAFDAAEVVDNDTGEISYPGLVLPDLVFQFDTIFENNFLDDKVSSRTLSIVTQLKTARETTASEIIDKINTENGKNFKKLNTYSKPKSKFVSINDSEFEINPLPAGSNYVITTNKLAGTDLYSLYVSVYNPDANDSINSIELTIGSDNELSFDSFNYENNVHTFELFKDGISLSGDTFTVSGNIVSSKQGDIPIASDDVHKGAPKAKPTQSVSDFQKPFDGEPGIGRPIYGVKKLEIAEFKRVEQELCCYVEGEVSHIENIMAREYKERSTRNLTRSELTTESTSEREVENLTDTTTTDRLELQSEITNVLEEAKDRSFGGSVGSNFGKNGKLLNWNVNVNAYFDGTNSSSESTTFNESESAAREVVSRALDRVISKTSEKRTSRMVREFEENNKHGFDNRKGDQHVTGIYRWVDKIYKNYLVNYGKRLVYEFSIPEPSRAWKEMLGAKDQLTIEKPLPPKTLEEMGIIDAYDLYNTNYSEMAGEYGVEMEPMRPIQLNLGLEMAELPGGSGQIDPAKKNKKDTPVSAHKASIEIPEGYIANGFTTTGRHVFHGPENHNGRTVVTVGDKTHKFEVEGGGIPLNQPPTGSTPISFGRPISGSVPVSLYTKDIVEFSLNVVVNCGLMAEERWAWQKNSYIKLMSAYKALYQEYMDKLAQWTAEQQAKSGSLITNNSNNPITNRIIEQTELKRIGIQMMMDQAPISASNDHYVNAGLCDDLSKVNQTQLLDEHAKYLRFFERAFDWGLMDYNFHPYFYSSACNWSDLIKNKVGADTLFEAFLQSGMATMKLPVKAGFERVVLFFLDTGLVIDKEEYVTIDREDNLYQSVLTSLRMSEHPACCDCDDEVEPAEDCCGSEDDSCIEAKWISRIPTSLTIVQDYSRPLKGNGLPCYNSDSERIQFCEDGTPVGADEYEEGGSATVGLMEGFEDPNQV